MSLDKYRIKFRKISDRISMGSPQYSLTYRSDPQNAAGISHGILSALIEKNDVIIEINSDMNGSKLKNYDPVADFMDKTGQFDLAYRKKLVPSEKNNSFLSFLMGSGKRKQASEALIYIPNSVWFHPVIKDCLPVYGARYYITEPTADAAAKLNETERLNEEGIAAVFRMIIFDLAVCGQMGISSMYLSMDEIKGMLGL